MEVFISYSHNDVESKKWIVKCLKGLERQGLINQWFDTKMDAGDHIDDEVRNHLLNSKIILLLLSFDFFASDYIMNIELPLARKQYQQKLAFIVPIVLKDCPWKNEPLIKGLLALPDNGKPITGYRPKEKAYLIISEAIRNLAEKIRDNTKEIPVTPIPAVDIQTKGLPQKGSSINVSDVEFSPKKNTFSLDKKKKLFVYPKYILPPETGKTKIGFSFTKNKNAFDFSLKTKTNSVSSLRIRNRWRFTGTIEKPKWEWDAFIDDAGSGKIKEIDHVIYHLHPSFKRKNVSVDNLKTKFKIEMSGGNTFTLRSTVYMKNGTTKELQHYLRLHFNPKSGVSE